ncbi:hypothetical protein N3K66_000669 [Trichothecium roseum]|uniref:Uncharacterized protein n=1 Tax=Trichothecium roseum TaxID=47278 RepID=A0ACC0VE82_9HYPO|nr:hypothetical protein N3K66_000669 [Trichothecium roseum]
MPARTNDGGKRFELPALNFNFGSITDGTDIPPPLDSPVIEAKEPESTIAHAPATAATPAPKIERKAVPSLITEANQEQQETGSATVEKPTQSNEGHLSTTNGTNGNAAPPSVASSSRPVSHSGNSFQDERKAKRSSGWFRRLRGGDSSKRSSMVLEQQQVPEMTRKASVNPPPPMIPELKDLEKDQGSLGGYDLFKNIK